MDLKQIAASVEGMNPRQRMERFSELDAWFSENPTQATVVTVGGPSGFPTTALERQDKINERLVLAFAVARDAVEFWHQMPG